MLALSFLMAFHCSLRQAFLGRFLPCRLTAPSQSSSEGSESSDAGWEDGSEEGGDLSEEEESSQGMQ